MDETDALDALERLGLTGYEARMLVGLQKLGTATASEIAGVTDVPRSQVYGTADSLEERGLIEVQNASPTRYRAVPLEAAMDRLSERFERERSRAAEYLRSVEGSLDDRREDRQSDIWITRGEENVTSRVEELLATAEDRVLVGTGDVSHLPESVLATLQAVVDDGVEAVGITEDEGVAERFGRVSGIVTVAVEAEETLDVETSRLVVVDGRTVLISMVDETPGGPRETAMWSENTTFASLLARLISAWFEKFQETRGE